MRHFSPDSASLKQKNPPKIGVRQGAPLTFSSQKGAVMHNQEKPQATEVIGAILTLSCQRGLLLNQKNPLIEVCRGSTFAFRCQMSSLLFNQYQPKCNQNIINKPSNIQKPEVSDSYLPIVCDLSKYSVCCQGMKLFGGSKRKRTRVKYLDLNTSSLPSNSNTSGPEISRENSTEEWLPNTSDENTSIERVRKRMKRKPRRSGYATAKHKKQKRKSG